jgi:hypothetical protein
MEHHQKELMVVTHLYMLLVMEEVEVVELQ